MCARLNVERGNKYSVIIIIGIILLIISIVILILPLTWNNAKDISQDWEGPIDEGRYGSYNEGDKATVAGLITYRATIDEILANPGYLSSTYIGALEELRTMGFRYLNVLDGIEEVLIVSKEEVGHYHWEVTLVITLHQVEVGSTNFWVWGGESAFGIDFHYSIGGSILIISALVIGFGVGRNKQYRRRERLERSEQVGDGQRRSARLGEDEGKTQ